MFGIEKTLYLIQEPRTSYFNVGSVLFISIHSQSLLPVKSLPGHDLVLLCLEFLLRRNESLSTVRSISPFEFLSYRGIKHPRSSFTFIPWRISI